MKRFNINNEKGNSLVIGIVGVVILIIVAVVTFTGNDETIQNVGKVENQVIQNEEINNNSENKNNENMIQEDEKDTNTETHKHEYSVYLTSTKSTCVEPGIEKRKCKYCNEIQNIKKELDPANHSGQTKVEYINLNNTKHSKNTVCTGCQEVISKEEGIHNHKLQENISKATCTAKAVNQYLCTVCNITMEIEEGETLPHTWDNGIVTKKPTDNETGIKTYTCSICKETKTETIYE